MAVGIWAAESRSATRSNCVSLCRAQRARLARSSTLTRNAGVSEKLPKQHGVYGVAERLTTFHQESIRLMSRGIEN